MSRSITSLYTPLSRSLRYLLVLDFEATCGDTIPRNEMEIIEWPTLLYNIDKKSVQATFHEYVRPVRHPVLTEFCTSLTGITQAVVDSADTFPHVWPRFNEFLKTHGVFDDTKSYAFLTCGNWDLQTMLPVQLMVESATNNLVPASEIFDRWINVKTAFRKLYKIPRNHGMAMMLKKLQMPLEGRHHSGIDDCRNITRIVQRMQKDSWRPGEAVLSSHSS